MFNHCSKLTGCKGKRHSTPAELFHFCSIGKAQSNMSVVFRIFQVAHVQRENNIAQLEVSVYKYLSQGLKHSSHKYAKSYASSVLHAVVFNSVSLESNLKSWTEIASFPSLCAISSLLWSAAMHIPPLHISTFFWRGMFSAADSRKKQIFQFSLSIVFPPEMTK